MDISFIDHWGLDIRQVPNDEALRFLKSNTGKQDLKDIFIRNHDIWFGSYVNGRLVGVIGADDRRRCVTTDSLFVLPSFRIGVHALGVIASLLSRYADRRIESYCRPASIRLMKHFGFSTVRTLKNGTAFMVRESVLKEE